MHAVESLVFASAAAVGVFTLGFPLQRALAHWNVVDQPNARSSHSRPTVRGGGAAIMVVILGTALAAAWSRKQSWEATMILAAAFLVGAVSFLDDLKSLSRVARFGCHAVATVGALYALGLPAPALSLSSNFNLWLPPMIGFALSFVWIVGYTNGFNFMDGINGLAAVQALVTALGSALLVWLAPTSGSSTAALVACIIAGASIGFLPHNFPQARMFMGDVSSAPLGFLLAALSLWLARDYGWWLLIPLVLLHANYVLDTGITLIRRFVRGERWYEPHREHFYQRLVRGGKSHTFVTLLELALQLVVLALMVIYLRVDAWGRIWLIFAVLAVWGLFFAYCEYRFQRYQDLTPAS